MNSEIKELLSKAKNKLGKRINDRYRSGFYYRRSCFPRHGINDSRRIISYPA